VKQFSFGDFSKSISIMPSNRILFSYALPGLLILIWLLCIFPLFFDKSLSLPVTFAGLIWKTYSIVKQDFEFYFTSGAIAIAGYVAATAPNFRINKCAFISLVGLYVLAYFLYLIWDWPLSENNDLPIFLSIAGIDDVHQSEFSNSIAAIRIAIFTSAASLLGIQAHKSVE